MPFLLMRWADYSYAQGMPFGRQMLAEGEAHLQITIGTHESSLRSICSYAQARAIPLAKLHFITRSNPAFAGRQAAVRSVLIRNTLNTKSTTRVLLFRGAERIRTAVKGFADLCLATRPQRQKFWLWWVKERFLHLADLSSPIVIGDWPQPHLNGWQIYQYWAMLQIKRVFYTLKRSISLSCLEYLET